MGTPVPVSKTCLVRFDTNKYSVSASAVGRPVEIRAYADRVEFRQDGTVVGEHRRVFGRDQTVFDPWHYVPVLARKPGALRNGAPFKDWILPASLERVRRKLGPKVHRAPRGDRQMVDILSAVLTDGLVAVEAAPHPRARAPWGPRGRPNGPGKRSATACTRPTSSSTSSFPPHGIRIAWGPLDGNASPGRL